MYIFGKNMFLKFGKIINLSLNIREMNDLSLENKEIDNVLILISRARIWLKMHFRVSRPLELLGS